MTVKRFGKREGVFLTILHSGRFTAERGPDVQVPGWLNWQTLFLIILIFPLHGCTPSDQQKAESLRQEVIAIHDEAMTMMGPMYELELELSRLLEERKNKHLATGQQQEAIKGLIEAQEAMMDWMRKYSPPGKESPYPEVMDYFMIQKSKIIEVRRMIGQAVSNAETTLNSQSLSGR